MILWFLVIAQFTLSAALVLSTRWSPIPWLAFLVSAPGAALAVWAWGKVGLLKLRIHPTTTQRTRLITSGPFAVVRHPMYTGLLWFTAAFQLSDFAWWRTVAWFTLAIVLYFKACVEEKDINLRFAQYDTYRGYVGRFFPKF